MKKFLQLNAAGIVVSVVETKGWKNPPIDVIESTDGKNHLGEKWTGSGWENILPVPRVPVYTALEFIDALTDPVSLAIIASTDPKVKLIEKKFGAATSIVGDDPRLIVALDYLIGALQEMTEDIKAAICAAV
jgi:hypothetical protein